MPSIVVPVPSLVILCGPASSGKSTFAAKHFPPTAIVSSDRCRAMVADDEANMAVSRDAFEIFHQIIDARLQHRRIAVADSTAVQREARRALIQIARRRDVPTVLIVFNVSEEVCIQWNGRRTRRVGSAVIHQHSLALQAALGEIAEEGHAQILIMSAAEVGQMSVELARGSAAGVPKLS